MQNKKWDEFFINKQYYIDKTRNLEKGIEVFPSIYIEGAAASGKTTAVKMLLAKHPEVTPFFFFMDEESRNPSIFLEKLNELCNHIEESNSWVIFENMQKECPKEILTEIVRFISHLPSCCRVIFIGRERPNKELLNLLWKRKMEILPQRVLLLSKEEVMVLAEYFDSVLSPDEVFEQTGGWAGCVDVMFRLAANSGEKKQISVKKIRESYEIETYLQMEILETLSLEERELMRRGAVCPWMDEHLCSEVWKMECAKERLEILERRERLHKEVASPFDFVISQYD